MITVHIRRGDFKFPCEEGETPPCYIPLPSYRDAVLKMQAQLLKDHNINASRVLVASGKQILASLPVFLVILTTAYYTIQTKPPLHSGNK